MDLCSAAEEQALEVVELGEDAPDDPARAAESRAVDTFIRREDAERFVEVVRGDGPKLASHLQIDERDLEAGERN